jgi:hypothetical protein
VSGEMTELPEVALWRVTWWEPPDPTTTRPRKTTTVSPYWLGGTNHTAEVVASTMEVAIAAVRADNPTAVFANVTKASKTGLFYVAQEDRHE